MISRATLVLLAALLSGFVPVKVMAEKAVTIVDVKGHNEKNNVNGYIEDMINGSGMSLATPGLPSTWRATSNDYNDDWLSQGGTLDPLTSINSKLGWAVFDLGSDHSVSNIYIWQARSAGRVRDYNIYYATAPTVPVPDGPTDNTEVDYDFASVGWTKLNGSVLTLPAKGGTPDPAQAVVSLGGVTARYVAIEIITADLSSGRTGFAEVGITEVDNTAPTLASTDIVDAQGGASMEANGIVVYTLSFDEDMAVASITDADFENKLGATINILTVSNTTPAADTWIVEVQPTGAGDLQLQVKSGAVITDISGNALTGLPIADDTTITVNADVTPPTLAGTDIVDDHGGGPITLGTLVTYTVTFSEDMDDTTITADDFENGAASPAAYTFGSVVETATPGVFAVTLTPTSEGNLKLQVKGGAVLDDGAGNGLDTASAIADDTTIFVDGTAPTLASTSIVDDRGGESVHLNGLVTYTLTFSEDIDETTLSSADFDNVGTSDIIVGTLTKTGAGVFKVHIQPRASGSLQLQLGVGAVVEDIAGNALTVPAADNTILSVASDYSELAPISSVTAYHVGQGAGIGAVIDGSGMSQPDALDPATWTVSSTSWQTDDWEATGGLLNTNTSANGKIGWLAFDLGQAVNGLENLYLWNCYALTTAGIQKFNLYYATTITVPLPAADSSNDDYDFASGGWTLINAALPITMPIGSTGDPAPEGIVNLDGAFARYIGIEVMSNYGYSSRIGLHELAMTFKDPLPSGSLFRFR